MSDRDPYDLLGSENNILSVVKDVRKKLKRVLRRNVKADNLSEFSSTLGEVDGSFTDPSDDSESAIATDAGFTGIYFGANDITPFGETISVWMAYIAAGLISMGFGPDGIFARLFDAVITQISDDGTTYRKGRLGMTTLSGRTAPSFGSQYQDDTFSAELLTNGNFATNDLTGWTAGGLGIWSGAAGYAKVDTGTGNLMQAVNVTPADILFILFSLNSSDLLGSLMRVTLNFYTGAGGTGTLWRSNELASVSTVIAEWVDYSETIVIPPNVASVVLMLEFIKGAVPASASFDNCSLKVGPPISFLGFEPVNGEIVANMPDEVSRSIGRIPVFVRTVLRVDEVKDKLVATGGAAGNVGVGTHYLITTFVDEYGETDADLTQASSVVIATSAKTVALTAIPLGKWGTTARKVYATPAGATISNPLAYYLLLTINDNTTTTDTYNVSDANLIAGALIPTINTTGSRPIFPRCASVMAEDILVSYTQANFARTIIASHPYEYTYNPVAANANDGDEYYMSFMLEAGMYNLNTLGVTAASAGKHDHYLDGVLVGSAQEWYSATTVVNVVKTIASVVVPTSGYHHLMIKINGKHASSTDYAAFLTRVWMTPAAY